MEITIKRSANQQQNLKKVVWKRFGIKRFFLLLAIIGIGLIFLFNKRIGNNIEIPFWNFGSAFGMAILTLGILRLIDLLKLRNVSPHYISDDSIIIITENHILIKELKREVTLQWQYFKYYQINGPLIVFQTDLSLKQTLVLHKDELSSIELDFINHQISNKKILKK